MSTLNRWAVDMWVPVSGNSGEELSRFRINPLFGATTLGPGSSGPAWELLDVDLEAPNPLQNHSNTSRDFQNATGTFPHRSTAPGAPVLDDQDIIHNIEQQCGRGVFQTCRSESSVREKEHQTGDGCSGGKLRNTPHLIIYWICSVTVSRRQCRRAVEGITY